MATTKKGRWMGMRWVLLLLLVFSLGLSGCDDESDSDTCSGAQIEPHQSPVIFGELYPLGSNEEDLASSSHTPYEWVLQLRSLCSEDVEIEKVCLIGEADKNGNDVGQYIIEGPLPTTADIYRVSGGKNYLQSPGAECRGRRRQCHFGSGVKC